MMNIRLVYYPAWVGLLLGLFQTGLLLQMTFTLSSSFAVYLMLTLCWLIGSALGVLLGPWLRQTLNAWLVLAVAAYLACGALLALLPFETRLWPLYAGLTVLVGLYPGAFFARQSGRFSASSLLFAENNGFILGLIFGVVGFALLGRPFAWGAPCLIASLIFIQQRQAQGG